MSVCGRVAFGGSDATTMATAEPEGNRRPGLFPRLLLKLPRLLLRLPRLLLRLPRLLPRLPRCPCCGWQKTLGENRPRPGSSTGDDWRHKAMRIGQLFSSDLIRLSNSSNEVSPLIISPLIKKVGVELTFSTSLANF